MDTNPIYDSTNQPVTATVGTNTESSLSGLPLGKSVAGEVFLKTGSLFGAELPYGADNFVITNVTAGPATITYKLGSTVLKTRTLTYTNAGASVSDVLTNVADT